MDKTLPTLLLAAAAALVLVAAPDASLAGDAKDEAINLDQHVNPDTTPQQRHQAALAVAEANLRKNLARCDKLETSDRAECVREARALHDADVAKASDVLERPQ